VRQIYPLAGDGPEPDLARLYAYPPGEPAHVRVRANMVASADGAAALDGRSGGLAGRADRQVFGLLRAMADVILVGAGTAAAEHYRPARVDAGWTALRAGRSPTPPIAVVTGRLAISPDDPLLTGTPAHARTILITTASAPADRRAALAAKADMIIAGQHHVSLPAAVATLAQAGHRRILTEGGPHLLGQIAEAGLLDELCLTISPLLAGGQAGRIIQATGQPPGNAGLGPLTLAHVLEDEGFLLCRYVRPARPA
jgi:riboflavin biosynthesis pyrimidine reductase